MQKKILSGTKARTALVEGIDQLANTIKATLGPKGRNVVIASIYTGPYITNDGATIAREFILENAFENVGIELVKEVALKTNELAGDGTTTATLLVQEMIHQGIVYIDQGYSPILIKEGIQKAVSLAVQYLDTIAKEVTTVKQVENIASVSSGDTMIGKMIGDAFKQVGKDMLLSIEEVNGCDISLEIQNGFRIDEGFISPYMLNDQAKMVTEFNDPYFIITNQKIENIQQITPVLEQLIQVQANVVLISNAIDEKVLSTLVLNTMQDVLHLVAIKAPSSHQRQKEMLEDIATITGGKVISPEFGLPLEEATIDDLGRASKVLVSQDTTSIINGQSNAKCLQYKKQQIKKAISLATLEFERVELENRFAKFNESAAIIKVGAVSALELKEKKMKIEDAICATKVAIQEGVLVGGGKAYLNTADYLEKYSTTLIKEEKMGFDIVCQALQQPTKQLLDNAGIKDKETIFDRIHIADVTVGYDINQDILVDMFEEGIIDPAVVEKVALQSAASIASLILTTQTVLVDANNEEMTKKGWNDQLLQDNSEGLF